MAGRIQKVLMGDSPRAATTDAGDERARLMAMYQAVSKISAIPGLIDKIPAGANDNAVYSQGLKLFTDGDTPGAVNLWATIPHHPEARRAMERVYQQGKSR